MTLQTLWWLKKTKKKRRFWSNLNKALQNLNTKMIIDFDCKSLVNISSLPVNKSGNVKVMTRFFSGKMLMFAKLSLMSFIYKLTETFYFPSRKTIEIYNKYNIERTFLYHVLTDTDSTCIMFLIICNVENNIPTKNFANYFLKLTLPTKFTTGLIPLTLTGKILMRENWSCKNVWDTLKLKV